MNKGSTLKMERIKKKSKIFSLQITVCFILGAGGGWIGTKPVLLSGSKPGFLVISCVWRKPLVWQKSVLAWVTPSQLQFSLCHSSSLSPTVINQVRCISKQIFKNFIIIFAN
jgi:hypothetical protein